MSGVFQVTTRFKCLQLALSVCKSPYDAITMSDTFYKHIMQHSPITRPEVADSTILPIT